MYKKIKINKDVRNNLQKHHKELGNDGVENL